MTHDYGSYTPEPPTAEALAIRDRLAEELAAAPVGSARRWHAGQNLASHLVTVGLPLEDFSTASGRAFVVKVSVSKPKPKAGRETEARRWLNGRNPASLAHKLLDRGEGLPADLFEPLNPRVNVEPA